MEHGTPEDRNRVFAACVGKVLQMSHDKFASNILENVLKKGSMPEKVSMITIRVIMRVHGCYDDDDNDVIIT